MTKKEILKSIQEIEAELNTATEMTEIMQLLDFLEYAENRLKDFQRKRKFFII